MLFNNILGSYVSVYLADSEKKYEYKKLMDNSTLEEHATISSVVPADFDGDLQMDLLITSTIPGKENSAVTCRIYWGDEGNLDTGLCSFYYLSKLELEL
ncbi:hypothetical protein DPMN_152385 [Dreissena polymorpha]|uniref:Uncharacterized protein n=1 Tax=Dreissena polymorpha TaxID=45954 RepID=A0A9D4FMX6_DREPO|nr:hypothetical protein DPMN_152385 [Dreissena polymorpha]